MAQGTSGQEVPCNITNSRGDNMEKSRGAQVRITLPPGAVVKYALMEIHAPQGTNLVIKAPYMAKAATPFLDAVRRAGGTVGEI